MNLATPNLRGLVLGLAGVGLLQASASAQFDCEITNISVTQAIQNNTVDYVAGRTMFVRVETAVTGASLPQNIDGVMRVYVNGIEAADSPVYSYNGPYAAQASSNLNLINGTLNFIYLPPLSDDVQLTVELNPPGPNQIPEGDTSNNNMDWGPFEFFEKAVPQFTYSPIDYRPSGGGPNVPSASLIEPGMGDNFIQGIYATKDIFYHRTDAPSKLWTSSLSGSGSALNNSLLVDRNSMVPKPDFLYGWVPGGLPYNGQSIINSSVSMGNTQSFKYQRTYAHEVGHNVGRSHTNLKIAVVGVDAEHHLALPASNNLGMAKASTLNDIMVAGLNTNQAWVRANFYNHVFNHPTFQPNDDDSADAASGPGTLIAGVWNSETKTLSIGHVLDIEDAEPTSGLAPSGQPDFALNAYSGTQLVYSAELERGSEFDSCADADTGNRMVETSIHAILPRSGAVIDRVEIQPMAGVQADAVTLLRSPNAPQVQFESPGVDGDVSAGLVTVAWSGSDADGDELTYYLRYSRNGEHFTPLATGITETQWRVDLATLPALVDGKGFFQILASDGLNSTVVNSSTLKGSSNIFADGGNDPWVEVVTPDSDNAYPFGSPVIFHSSGWDLEDRKLLDPAITWSSSLDGPIGTGRLMSVDDLSVGVHLVTVTATDSDLQTATDATLVNIVARALPTVPSGPQTYCTAGTSASSCVASISASGTPSATAATGFFLNCASVEGQKDGQFFFGTSGQQANAWGSGTSFQCVVPPTKRGGVQAGNGTLGGCDGAFSQDMNARWQAKPAQNPGAGNVVQAQFWYRDPQNTSNQTTSLSDAIEFTVQP